MASTSSWVRLMFAAARFSWTCSTLVVPGIGSAVTVRWSCQASAICCGVALCFTAIGSMTAWNGSPSGPPGIVAGCQGEKTMPAPGNLADRGAETHGDVVMDRDGGDVGSVHRGAELVGGDVR